MTTKMSLFKRLFSSKYRSAVSAEAAGDFLTAARYYALCGKQDKVVDMHLAQARLEITPDDRIRELRIAQGFVAGEDSRRDMILRLLGNALQERARAIGVATARGAECMREAAATLEEAESWQAAGDSHLELGDRARAATAYSRAGLVERVEEVLSQDEREHRDELQEDSFFADYEMLLQGGQRDEAAEALRRCIELAQTKGDYRRLLTGLEQQMLRGGRVELRLGQQRLLLLGQFPVVVGRDADCDLQVRGHSVSRQHARILAGEDGPVVEDAHSRNGTMLGGMPLERSVPLPPSGTIGLGGSAALVVEVLASSPPTVRLQVSQGLDQDKTAVVSQAPLEVGQLMEGAPPLVITFSRGRPMASSSSEMMLGEARVSGSIQLIRGDELTIAGKIFRVIG